jgi:hypothetical protein
VLHRYAQHGVFAPKVHPGARQIVVAVCGGREKK